MSNKRISELTAAGALTGNELVEVVQGGTNVKTTTQDIADLGGGGGGSGDVVGPASATDSVPVLFSGTTGKLVKNSTPTGTGNPVLATGPTLSNPIVGTQSPSDNSTKAASTAYVDAAIIASTAGLKWKDSVRAATTTAGTLATSFENGDTIDGVVLATGNRILLKNQADATENGIRIVAASGAPARSTDADAAAELEGAVVSVLEGTSNANTTWAQTTDNIILGVSNVVWAQFGTSIPTADASTAGIAKLYTTPYGTNTDGSVHQSGLNSALRRARTVTGTDSVVQADDSGLIIFNSAGPFNFTLDQLTSDLGSSYTTRINYVNIGAGAVTLTNGSGVTLVGTSNIPGAVGTNYPAGFIYYSSATSPRHVVAAIDDDLVDIADLSPTNDDVLQRKAGVWTSRSMAQLRADLMASFTSVLGIATDVAGVTCTNAANSEGYLNGQGVFRRRFDATGFLEVRITTLVGTLGTGANLPRLYPQYTTDMTAATGWTTIGAGTIASGDAISLLTPTGEKASNWITLPTGAKADVLFRVAINGGDGAGDPAVFNVLMHFRN